MTNLFSQISVIRKPSNEALDLVCRQHQGLDPDFVVSGAIKDRRDKFQALWSDNLAEYLDSRFLQELSRVFHARTWELYVANVIRKLGIRLLKGVDLGMPRDEGPDFVLEIDGRQAYVECVAVGPGEPRNMRGEPTNHVPAPANWVVTNLPTDEIILRITAGIKEKFDKYQGWKGKNWFCGDAPFIVAINYAECHYPDADEDMPFAVKAVTGFQYPAYDRRHNFVGYTSRSSVSKLNGSPVPTKAFESGAISDVGALIFSNNFVLNHPERIGEDCGYVNNPYARNPVGDAISRALKSWHVTKEGVTIPVSS